MIMKKYIILILFVFIGFNVFSQITVTDTDVASIGDVIYQGIDIAPSSNIQVGNSGPNQLWDFSSLQAVNYSIMNVISPNGTPYASSYPNANICIEDDGEYTYIHKSNTGIDMLGIEDSVFQQGVLLLPLPLSYGIAITDGPTLVIDSVVSGNLDLLLATQGLSAFLLTGGVAHTADTLQIQGELTTDFDVDAYGQIVIPMGTFDCLRLKMTRSTSINIAVYCTDTLTGNNSGWFPLPFSNMENETSYQWYSNDPSTKFLLAEIGVDSLGNTEGEVIFLTNGVSTIEEKESLNLNIYPVPTTDILTVELKDNTSSKLSLSDINGKVILDYSFIGLTQLDLADYSAGIYYLTINTEDVFITKKIIVQR